MKTGMGIQQRAGVRLVTSPLSSLGCNRQGQGVHSYALLFDSYGVHLEVHWGSLRLESFVLLRQRLRMV